MTEISHALYRKYRPTQFDEVRNQEHIVRVLIGALEKNTIPHALLFTGSRGTGKTTVARIFAHAIGAHDIDIYEIDAASNRGIDDIRELKESVYTAPYESPYKVYIIDEVHMLTKEAFNALLKMLEEPPQYVVFILATTEKDKVIDTIISRCQVFAFHAPTREQLRTIVLDIAKKEQYTMDTSVADVIALSADGSYRDALGITQKVMMASGDTILSADEVAEIVGAPKRVLLHDLLNAFAEKNVAQGLTILEQIAESTVDIKLFYKLFLEYVRSVLLLRHNPQHILAKLSETYSPDDVSLIEKLAKDTKAGIHSGFLSALLIQGEYIGKNYVRTLPLELLLIEHCNK